jgi:hypothetical protein
MSIPPHPRRTCLYAFSVLKLVVCSHEGWLRNTVCCDGAETRGMTSWPLVIERVTASSVPSAVAHAAPPLPLWDFGMMGQPPSSLRTSSSHCERRRFPHTKAAITPSDQERCCYARLAFTAQGLRPLRSGYQTVLLIVCWHLSHPIS